MNNLTIGDEFINQELPQADRMLFPKHFQAAYDAVTELTQSTPFLKSPSAKIAARGYLHTWAVEFALSQLIQSGQWNADFKWFHFSKPTGRYLRIYTKNAIVTVSQCENTSKQPRRAIFRSNAGYDNQRTMQLFADDKDLSGSGKRPHLLLIHGYHSLDFIHVAMPNPSKVSAWLGITKNLMTELRDISTGLTPTEGPETISTPTIKEQLKKQIYDHGN